MAEYKKNYRSAGPRARAFNTRPFAQKELFDAECSSCHQRCQVPFRPNGKKPVFCTNCFKREDGASDRMPAFHRGPQAHSVRTSTHEGSDRQLQDLKREIQTMNATLKELVVAVNTFNRSAALALEVQKHVSHEAPAVKKGAAKKSATKTVTKKTAKK